MENQNKLSNYVSNLDRDIYTVYNLPEEVIATVFAYVSRSPKGFRENLLTVTEDKAKAFHEKWVLNYGHASVAELATVHIGIEKVSRLFSAILERSNLYFSPIEYSQRYQKPKKGEFHTPEELNNSEVKEEYIRFQNEIYDEYISLFEKLKDYLLHNSSMEKGETEKAFNVRIEKTAFEDARYVLTLAVHTNLGISSNARAIEDALIHLLSSEYSEVRNRALEIKNEVCCSLPTLVKYAKENSFLIDIHKKIQNLNPKDEDAQSQQVKLLSTNFNTEEDALNHILSELAYQNSHLGFDNLLEHFKSEDKTKKMDHYLDIFKLFSSHDNPPEAFEEVRYKFELTLSESCWHQLLRHRKIRFSWEYPTVNLGYIIPPNIKKANLEESFISTIEKIDHFYNKVKSVSTLAAHYCVSNAHNRRVIAEFSLWELFHLCNLRMMPQAQWEIRDLMEEIVVSIKQVHPNLMLPAIERVNKRKN